MRFIYFFNVKGLTLIYKKKTLFWILFEKLLSIKIKFKYQKFRKAFLKAF